MKPGDKGVVRIIKAAGYSFKGLRAAWLNESAFRQETVLFVVLSAVALWLPVGYLERTLLIGSLFIVLIVELLNSAIEAVVDRVGDEFHELSGRAKDLGSAAVFISLALVVFVWAVILFKVF